MSVVLAPVVKDAAVTCLLKTIVLFALASVFSKRIEVIILGRIKLFLDTNSNQLGIVKKHGTDQCIYICFKGNY